MLKLDKDMETIAEEIKTDQPAAEKPKSNLCFYMQFQVSKISVQVLEAQDFKSDIVKNLKTAINHQRISSEDRRQSAQWSRLKDEVKTISESLKQRYYIELKIKQKGAPFLNFEISKLSAAVLHVPSCEDQGPDTYLASFAIRDICLTNQQYSQVILRSANYIIEDQVRFSEADFSEVRHNSIDFSQRSETSVNKKNRNSGGRLFDLEDEDMIRVEQSNDEIPDNFMSVSVLS